MVVVTLVVTVFAPKIDVSSLALAKLKPVELGVDVANAGILDAGADILETVVAAMAGLVFTNGALADPIEVDKNENVSAELVFVIGLAETTTFGAGAAVAGLFSLSIFGLSVKEDVEKALPMSNLIGVDVLETFEEAFGNILAEVLGAIFGGVASNGDAVFAGSDGFEVIFKLNVGIPPDC